MTDTLTPTIPAMPDPASALRALAPKPRWGVFDGDRLVDAHDDPEVARLAAWDNADATNRPAGAYKVEELCPLHPTERASECCPDVDVAL